jgi:hypothetical protein
MCGLGWQHLLTSLVRCFGTQLTPWDTRETRGSLHWHLTAIDGGGDRRGERIARSFTLVPPTAVAVPTTAE